MPCTPSRVAARGANSGAFARMRDLHDRDIMLHRNLPAGGRRSLAGVMTGTCRGCERCHAQRRPSLVPVLEEEARSGASNRPVVEARSVSSDQDCSSYLRAPASPFGSILNRRLQVSCAVTVICAFSGILLQRRCSCARIGTTLFHDCLSIHARRAGGGRPCRFVANYCSAAPGRLRAKVAAFESRVWPRAVRFRCESCRLLKAAGEETRGPADCRQTRAMVPSP